MFVSPIGNHWKQTNRQKRKITKTQKKKMPKNRNNFDNSNEIVFGKITINLTTQRYIQKKHKRKICDSSVLTVIQLMHF